MTSVDLRSQTLSEELRGYRAADARERESVDRILRFLESSPAAFDRANPQGHVTGSAVVAREDGSAFLLVKHKKLARWLQPGGHCDPDDGGVLATALREAQEETGVEDLVPSLSGRPIDVDVHPIPARGEEPPHLHYDVRYLVTSRAKTAAAAEEEVERAGWFTLDQALEMGVDESLARSLKKAKTNLITRRP
jgi:8-oxo-dGTP pyrophosphatase MutT (NUDIX family)